MSILVSIFFLYIVESSKSINGFYLYEYTSKDCGTILGYQYKFQPEGCYPFYDFYGSFELYSDNYLLQRLCNDSECSSCSQQVLYQLDKCLKFGFIYQYGALEKNESDYFDYTYFQDQNCTTNLDYAMIYDSNECLKCDCDNYYKLFCDGDVLNKHVFTNPTCDGKPAEKYIAHEECQESKYREFYSQNSCKQLM